VAQVKYFFCNFLFFFIIGKKKFDFFCFLLIETQNPPDLPDEKTPLQNWSNPPQIRHKSAHLPKIFFARQTTFKSARIVQIWRRKLPSGNADTITETAPNQQKQSRFIYTHPSDIKYT
jgi:hypothetical protein